MNKNKFIFITAFFTIFAFLLTRVIWPDLPDMPQPSPTLLPFFIIYSFIDSLAFGVGMAYLILFWKKGQENLPVFLALVWLLISWWPHDNLHRVTPEGDYLMLAKLEYGFHFTLIVAGFILFKDFIKKNLSKS